jgi:hypothetical protein
VRQHQHGHAGRWGRGGWGEGGWHGVELEGEEGQAIRAREERVWNGNLMNHHKLLIVIGPSNKHRPYIPLMLSWLPVYKTTC